MKTDKQLKNIENMRTGINLLCGIPGTGKTTVALEYCRIHTESLYFTFHYIDIDFAPVIFGKQSPGVFNNCRTWSEFFSSLDIYCKEKSPAVFFDSVGRIKNENDFYQELNNFSEQNKNVKIILIGMPRDNISEKYKKTEAEIYSMPELADVFSLSDDDAAKIFSLTSGLPELIEEYDKNKSFEENVNAMLNINSKFYQLALNRMKDCFRTPDTYITLLYSMAQGQNRISELSKILGYPGNKCDKYIKSLIEYGLVEKVKCKNGYSKYYPANTYLRLWFRTFITAVPNADGSFSKETQKEFIKYFNENIMTEFYKTLCFYWIENNINSFSVPYINTDDLSLRNVKIRNITFDFAAENENGFYAYFDCTADKKLSLELWDKIEEATTEHRMFYDNEYFFCTVNRVPDSYWRLSKSYDNVHIVQKKSLFTEFKKKFNTKTHPRFVPGFAYRDF